MQKSRKLTKVIHGKPHVRIGKNGLTEGVVAEVERWLRDEGIIKVRVMRSLINYQNLDIEAFAEGLARLVNARVVDIRGNTFILIKMRSSNTRGGGAAGGT